MTLQSILSGESLSFARLALELRKSAHANKRWGAEEWKRGRKELARKHFEAAESYWDAAKWHLRLAMERKDRSWLN